MIGIDINGGLGNQLFQFATGYAVSRKNDDNLLLNTSTYDIEFQKINNLTIRTFQLDKFNIKANTITLKINSHSSKISKLANRVKKINTVGTIFNTKFYKESNPYEYNPDIYNYKNNTYLCGYFQSWKYFDEYRNELKQQLSIQKTQLSEGAIRICNQCKTSKSIALHIRRGDYINTSDWLIDERFYLEALKRLGSLIDLDSCRIYVFCDQEGFAEKLLKDFKNVVFVSAFNLFTDLEEFWMMKSCNNHIISNSSFSWWAAYLCDNREQIVFAPAYKQWNTEFYLPNWHTISSVSANLHEGK